MDENKNKRVWKLHEFIALQQKILKQKIEIDGLIDEYIVVIIPSERLQQCKYPTLIYE